MNRFNNSHKEGTEAEIKFLSAADKNNFKFIRKATPNEDMNQHWDFLFEYEGRQITIDVKAHKHEYRDGPLLKYWFWVEYRNVRGNNGWLFGEADYIAFEYFGRFLIYNRKELAERVLELVDDEHMVSKASEAHNKIYQRYGRQDQVSLVKISDLPIPQFSWTIS